MFAKSTAKFVVAAAILLAQPALGESLLIVEPVTSEVLGNLVKISDEVVFVDCFGNEMDPADKEIRNTQDTCDPLGIILATSEVQIIDQPVFAAGVSKTLIGKIDYFTVEGSGDFMVGITGADGFKSTAYLPKANVLALDEVAPNTSLFLKDGALDWRDGSLPQME